MFIKQIFVITAFLLITGCAGNNVTNREQPPQAKVETHARNAASTSTLTQASSIATPNAGKSSITIKQAQAPNNASYWLDWFNRNYGPAKPKNQAGTPKAPADSSQFAQQVLNLVNKERTKAGLQPLSMNGSLSKMAMAKAQDMYNNNYFAHQSPTYGSPFDMMKSFGISYRTAGENIAKGQRGPSEVMNSWMNSTGHRANILNRSFTQIGVAYYNGGWVQAFIG